MRLTQPRSYMLPNLRLPQSGYVDDRSSPTDCSVTAITKKQRSVMYVTCNTSQAVIIVLLISNSGQEMATLQVFNIFCT